MARVYTVNFSAVNGLCVPRIVTYEDAAQIDSASQTKFMSNRIATKHLSCVNSLAKEDAKLMRSSICDGLSLKDVLVKSVKAPQEVLSSCSGFPLSGPGSSITRGLLLSLASTMVLMADPGAAMAEDLECAPVSEVNRTIVIASIAEAVGLIGAGVGGYVARKRKDELERINAQLRQINLSLRRQARVETYAPSLSYAPVAIPVPVPAGGGGEGGGAPGQQQQQQAQASTSTSTSASAPAPALVPPSRMDQAKEELLMHLKAGKKGLRENNPQVAFGEFETALKMASDLGDTVEEKKAARGLGASCQRQGKFKDAIEYHKLVLKTSRRTKEHSGETEALGAIADCYTELGDLEAGAKYYDQYIARLEADDEDKA